MVHYTRCNRRLALIAVAAVGQLVSVPGTVRAQQRAHAGTKAGERLGTVHFVNSCRPSASARFDRGVALLHSFEFADAIRAFQDVLAADSSCAMAHWAIALSRWGNPMAAGNRAPALLQLGREAADAAVRMSTNASARERDYARAVSHLYADADRVDQRTRIADYAREMKAVATKHTTDVEAQIFYAVALTAAASPTDKSYANQRAAGRILEPIWAKQPDHPGLAHYIIHAYDHPPLAAKARAAAQRYARIAPSAAHALHMPSHTFTRVGQWQESVDANLRSVGVAMNDSSIAEALHASDYAVYANLQMRREAEARRIIDGLPALAARFDPSVSRGAAPGSAGVFALAAMPARFALERHDWAAAAALTPMPSAFPWTEAMVHFARALGATRMRTTPGGAASPDIARAQASVDSLEMIRQRLLAKGEPYWAEQVAIQALGARAWIDHVEGRDSAAVAAMREAADREDATEKSVVTPGPLAPARELLGDMLLELRRPEDALAAYRTALRNEPNRYLSLEGALRAAIAAVDRTAASGYAAALRALTKR